MTNKTPLQYTLDGTDNSEPNPVYHDFYGERSYHYSYVDFVDQEGHDAAIELLTPLCEVIGSTRSSTATESSSITILKGKTDKIVFSVRNYPRTKDVMFCGDSKEVCDKYHDLMLEVINLDKFKEKKRTFSVVGQNSRGFFLRKFAIQDGKVPEELGNFYNDETVTFDDIVKKKLLSGRNGLVLLHGDPGTGKTSYIRYLISTLNKNIIYLPPNLAAALADPGFQTFIIDNGKDSVMIIEDAENILMTREAGGNQAVSNILNLSDGIMGDALQVQFVCTFNTDIKLIDEALRRPGRLLGEHKFEKLNEVKAKKLVQELYGEEHLDKVKGSKTIAEIYSLAEKIPMIKEAPKSFGFILDSKSNMAVADDDY